MPLTGRGSQTLSSSTSDVTAHPRHMAHRIDPWPRPRRWERAQFVAAVAGEAFVLGLFFFGFMVLLPIAAGGGR